MELLLATRNAHKAREFHELLGDDFAVRDLSVFPEITLPEETGRTFAENARSKAIAISQDRLVFAGLRRGKQLFVLADDSGLEVDALGSAPGIFSARYAGKGATDKQNIEKLLREMERVGAHEHSQRSARFRCVLALACAGKILGVFSGIVEGMIVDVASGSAGFGYDPVFLPNGYEQTFGELPAHVKNKISHRARAVDALRATLAGGAFD
jgi:XTP/dITP diphosphohydrolase